MMTAQPVPPGERLPDAKVLVDDWTLDCLLDWVFGQDDLPESVEHHHDRLRADMERAVTDADLRAVLDEFGWRELREAANGVPEIIARLRAALGEQE